MSDLSRRLAKLRLAAGMTQVQLVERLHHDHGIQRNPSYITKIETGARVPTDAIARALAHIYEVDERIIAKQAESMRNAQKRGLVAAQAKGTGKMRTVTCCVCKRQAKALGIPDSWTERKGKLYCFWHANRDPTQVYSPGERRKVRMKHRDKWVTINRF